MPTMEIDFITEVARDYKVSGDCIVPIRGPKRTVRPLEINNTLYIQFAGLENNPDSFADFMRSFGPVTRSYTPNNPGGREGFLKGEQIVVLNELRRTIRTLLHLSTQDIEKLTHDIERYAYKIHNDFTSLESSNGNILSGIFYSPACIRAFLRQGHPDGNPRLSLIPDTLWDAIKLQFYQAISSGSHIKNCEWCGMWFALGGPTGKRGDAKFCKDECRLRAHRKHKGGPK